MSKMHHTWKRLRTYERVALLLSIVTVVTMLILGIMSLLQLFALQAELIVGLMALLMIAQTVQQWRKNRKPAYCCLLTAVVLVGFGFFVLFAL